MRPEARTRLFGRIAIAILLLAALAPSISRAVGFARGDGAPFSLLCSMAAPGATLPTGEDDAAGAMLDCPMCLMQAQGMLPPPRLFDSALLLLPGSEAAPSLFLRVQVPPPPRSRAQPRAPPRSA